MKKIFTFALSLALGAFITVNAQSTDGSKIEFTKTDQDFGTVKTGNPLTYTFEFVNKGTAPLVLSNVKAACGCTTPNWPKEPIAPGAKASITASYNNTGPGAFNKSITVTTMGGETVVLYLKGNAEAPAGDGATPTITPIKKP
jgi:hypothetical protein